MNNFFTTSLFYSEYLEKKQNNNNCIFLDIFCSSKINTFLFSAQNRQIMFFFPFFKPNDSKGNNTSYFCRRV